MLHRWHGLPRARGNTGIIRLLTTLEPKKLSTVEPKKILTLAIIGRPNTGKSTLYNRLTSSRMAIVSSVPGTTRDRRQGKGSLAGLPMTIVDTGGLDDRGAVSLQIQDQVEKALLDADVVLFMLDAKTGVTSLDQHFARWLRRRMGPLGEKKVVVVANKTEGAHLSSHVMDALDGALRLGLGEPVPISASHGDGMADLAVTLLAMARERGFEDGDEMGRKVRGSARSALASATDALPGSPETDGDAPAKCDAHPANQAITLEDRTIQLAVMGRPNVGKSTLINAFLGDDRLITGPTPGLTRDAIHVEWTYSDRNFRLVDTAGLTRLRPDKTLLSAAEEHRRAAVIESSGPSGYSQPGRPVSLPGIDLMNPELDPSQFSFQVSEFALISALNALRFAQVVLLVVDGAQGKFSAVDIQLARKCLEEGRALVIAGNKKDLVLARGVSSNAYEAGIRRHSEEFFREFGDVPIITCSALTGNSTKRLLDTVLEVHDAWSKRVPTWVLNKWIKDVMVTAAPPRAGGKALKLKYMTQIKSRPPTFALFCNADELPGFFERFLRSRLQTDFSLKGVPIRFEVRKTQGAAVQASLLKQGKQTRRGVGHGEGRGVGPNKRDLPIQLQRARKMQDVRRRRDTRLRNQRSGHT